MKYSHCLCLLSPLILLPIQAIAAEVDRVPLSSNINEVIPLSQSSVRTAIQEQGETRPSLTSITARPVVEPLSPQETARGRDFTPSVEQASPSKKDRKGDRKRSSSTSRSAALPSSAVSASAAQVSPPSAQPTQDEDAAQSFGKIVNTITQLREGGGRQEKEEALRLMKEHWEDILRFEDYGTMAAMAYTAMELNDEATALMAARKAAELTEDDQFYEVLAHVLMHFKHIEEVAETIKKMSPSSPERKKLEASIAILKANKAFDEGRYGEAESILLAQQASLDAGGLEMLGWIQYRLGKLQEAAQRFSEAYAKSPARSNAQGLVFSLHRLKRYEDLLSLAEAKPGPLEELLPGEVREAIKAGSTRFSVTSEGKLEPAAGSAASAAAPGVTITPGFMLRRKNGTAGEGRLEQRLTTVGIDWQGDANSLSLTLTRQDLDDGVATAAGQGLYALWQHTAENGFVYRLGAGLTPSGSVMGSTALGEAGVAYYTQDWGLGARLFRKPVDESLLSLVGKRALDPPGRWGRVLQTGLQLEGNARLGEWQAAGSLTFADLTGENVADNTKYEFYGQMLRPIPSLAGLRLGPELILSHHERNLSAYEFGHGGYFSPDRFLQLGVLALYEGQIDRVDLNVQAGLGYNWNWQDAAPGNPLTGAQPGKYPATRGQSVVYRVLVDAAWPLTPHWRIGGILGAQEAANYSDWRIGLYAKGFYD